MAEDRIHLAYAWDEADFPAYVHATRRHWELHHDLPAATSRWRATLGYYLYYLGPAVLGVVLLVAIEHFFPTYDPRALPAMRAATSAYGLVFLCVWAATYLVSILYRRVNAIPRDPFRAAFDRYQGKHHEVTLDGKGFRVVGDGLDGRYFWKDQTVPVEIWNDYALVLHPRMLLIVPPGAAPDGASALAAQVERLKTPD